MHQFLISLIVVEGDYWDSIVQLVAEGVNSVINDNEVLEVSVDYDPQVLYIDALLCPYAVLSVESILYKLPLRV